MGFFMRSRCKDPKTVDPPAPDFMLMTLHIFADTMFPNIDHKHLSEKTTTSVMLEWQCYISSWDSPFWGLSLQTNPWQTRCSKWKCLICFASPKSTDRVPHPGENAKEPREYFQCNGKWRPCQWKAKAKNKISLLLVKFVILIEATIGLMGRIDSLKIIPGSAAK